MKKIAVIFGGKSVEHDVSIITAHTPIIDSLIATSLYEVVPVYISKEGLWYSDQAMNDISFFKENLEEKLSKLKPVELSLNNEFVIIFGGVFKKKIKIDLVFPAMHGTFGEDGSLMGVLRMAGTAYVGCDLSSSSVAMDKVFTKQVLSADGLPVVPYIWFTKDDWQLGQSAILNKINSLKYPLFVKPVHLGSSIGITKVKTDRELENAIEVALHYDNKVLVEEGVENLIEVTLPIMGNNILTFANIERPLNKTEFFDFEDKYMGGGKNGSGVNNAYSEIPANMGEGLTKKVKDLGAAVYKTLGCSGIARVDFLIDSYSNDIYINEVNTLPGSLYHHNWKKAGISNIDLVTKLVSLAEERFESERSTTFTFKSDVLKKVIGPKYQ